MSGGKGQEAKEEGPRTLAKDQHQRFKRLNGASNLLILVSALPASNLCHLLEFLPRHHPPKRWTRPGEHPQHKCTL